MQTNDIITDNRIVSSYTFAIRFLNVLADIFPEYPNSSQMNEEEYEYMLMVAIGLIKKQFDTATDSDRVYFNNLAKDAKSAKEVILEHFRHNEDFCRFLKAGKFI